MNTSRRRTPGIACAITAGLLYGVVGIGTCAQAAADDAGRGSVGSTGGESPGPDGAGNAAGPRRHGRDSNRTPSGNTDAGGPVWHPGDPCPWWPVPRPLRPPAPVSGGNNSGLIAAVPIFAAIPAIPVPVFGADAQPRLDIGALAEDAPSVAAPAAAVPAAGYPAAAPPRPVPRVVAAPAAVPRARTAVISPPAAPASPPQRPVAGGERPAPVRLGYPDGLRDTDLAKAVSVALPGLAALVGMTAFGGLVGYRQARAGYLLRAAGAGRFLQ